MTYSADMRLAVLSLLKTGKSKAEAGRIFKVSRETIYRWLGMDDVTKKQKFTRNRKINKDALRDHVKKNPDMYLRERASEFGVNISSISRCLKKMNIRKKKNDVI